MDYLTIAIQVIIALGIFNVWILRFGKQTSFRGGEASNMREEFASYGLAGWMVSVVGGLKLGCAVALLVGIVVPQAVLPAASILAILMVGAIALHLKIKDPPKKSLPAVLMLSLCGYLVAISAGG